MIPQSFRTKTFEYKAYPLLNEAENRAIWEGRNNPEVRKWMTNPEPFSFEQHLAFVAGLTKRTDAIYYAVLYNGDVIGSICLNPFDGEAGEMGKYLLPQYAGHGYGFSFAQEFLEYVLTLGVQKIVAKTLVTNDRNQHVNAKLGFVETSRDDEYVYMEKKK